MLYSRNFISTSFCVQRVVISVLFNIITIIFLLSWIFYECYVFYYKYSEQASRNKQKTTCTTFTKVQVSIHKPNMLNTASHLATKCHNVIQKCHNVTEKCHTMTSCHCEIQKKVQHQSAGYVKVKLIASPLNFFAWIIG